MKMLSLLLLAVGLAVPALADISDSGSLAMDGNGVFGGTVTVQGAAPYSLVTSSGIKIQGGGLTFPDGSVSTTASTSNGQISVSSSATILVGGNYLAYDVIVSSFDSIAGVGVATMTIPSSTGTYTFECMGCQATVSDEFGIRFGTSPTPDATIGDYSGAQMWQEEDQGVNGDSNHGIVSRCYGFRAGTTLQPYWPYHLRIDFTVIGSLVGGEIRYHGRLNNATMFSYQGAGDCQYHSSNSAPVTSLFFTSVAGTGRMAGHFELRRRY